MMGGMGGGAMQKKQLHNSTPEEIKKQKKCQVYSKDKALEISKDFIRHNKN